MEATTSSLPALRKYSEGRRLMSLNGDLAGYFRLTEEAIALDSNFAMAYARLAIELINQNLRPADVARYAAKAYSLRNRLSDRDRVLVSFIYFRSGPVERRDPEMAARYLDSVITTSVGTSQEAIGLVFDGVRQATFGRPEKAESLYRTAFAGLDVLAGAQQRIQHPARPRETGRVREHLSRDRASFPRGLLRRPSLSISSDGAISAARSPRPARPTTP